MRVRSVTTERDPYAQLNPAVAPMGARSVTPELHPPFPYLPAEGEVVHHDHDLDGLGVHYYKVRVANAGSDGPAPPTHMFAKRDAICTRGLTTGHNDSCRPKTYAYSQSGT